LTAIAKEHAFYGDPVESKVWCELILFGQSYKKHNIFLRNHLYQNNSRLTWLAASKTWLLSLSSVILLVFASMINPYVSPLQAGQGAKLLNILAKYCDGNN
jgi:hypothetical protein